MSAEKALALVVRGTDWSETSRIVTLFTREFGKVRGLAKGGRRLKSNFDIAFDLLNVCSVVFLRKAHGGLDLLTEARAVERFPALRQNLQSLYAGYYVAELLADGTQDYDPHPALFDAALETLRGLGKDHQKAPAAVAAGAPGLAIAQNVLDSLISFELVWLRELGYSPRLDACSSCGADAVSPGAGVPRIDGSFSRPRATWASRVARTAASATMSIAAPAYSARSAALATARRSTASRRSWLE